MTMNWVYIAGFFDGEGSLCYSTSPMGGLSPGRITIAQSGVPGRMLLEEIRDFLHTQGIKCSVLRNRKRKSKPHWKPAWILFVNSRRGSLVFAKNVLPYVRIKRPACQDLIRFFTLFPARCGGFPEGLVSTETLRSDLESGLSIKEVSAKRGMKYSAVWRRLNRKPKYFGSCATQ
jgi:hypothetical protein